MHKKTLVFAFDFQEHHEFITFMADGYIRGSIYDNFTINQQWGYMDQEEMSKITFFDIKKYQQEQTKLWGLWGCM